MRKNYYEDIFSPDRFMPHGHCYFWEPEILWSHAISDSIIALAYLCIPLTLIYIFRRRDDFKFIWMMVLFAVFILGCGITHVFDVINIWKPMYYLDSGFRIITALASIGTAIVLIKVTPDILKIPSAEQWIKVNEELRKRQLQLEEAYDELKTGEEELQEKNLELTAVNYQLKTSYKEIQFKQRELEETNSKLEKAQDALKKLNNELEERVEERTTELEQKNRELTAINNDLDNFIYSASHDLKAPVVNMEGIINAFKPSFKETLAEREKTLIAMLETSIGKLKITIDYLTDVSKISKKSEEQAEPIDLKNIIRDVKTDLRPIINEVEPEIIEALEIPTIEYSKSSLTSIIANLLSNSLKYRSPGRALKIVFRSYLEDGKIVFSIEDNGLGIKQEHHEKIFILFKRMHNHVDGTGVGLYIVKRLVENSGNQIVVESEIDKGTKFKIYFRTEPGA